MPYKDKPPPGVCVQCRGKHGAPEGKHTRCPRCLEYVRNLLASRVKRGLCRDCGEPPVPGKVRCQKHLEEAAQRVVDRAAAKPDGMCKDGACRKPAVPGHTLCKKHLALHRKRQERYEPKRPKRAKVEF